MKAIAKADAKIRSNRGCSFLTKGGDDFDHRSLNKARRFQNRAAIDEQLEPDFIPQMPIYRWVVGVWAQDGDKYWLDDYVDYVFDEKSEAERFYRKEMARVLQNNILANLDPDDDGSREPAPTMEYREIEQWEIDQ